jgi:hypothetical protein
MVTARMITVKEISQNTIPEIPSGMRPKFSAVK